MAGKTIFQFNNIDKPYLLIRTVEGDNVYNLGYVEFSKPELENNLPIFNEIISVIDDFLTLKNVERDEAEFVINAIESSKITTVLPNISERKLKKMYEVEFANKLPNIDDYDCLSVVSESKNNRIFYEYIVDKKYREFFERVGATLSFKEVNIDYMNSYLFNELTSNINKKTFVYVYEEIKMAYLLVVINDELCGYSSFENSAGNYRLNFSSIVDKHIYDLEKADIEYVLTNKEIPCLAKLNPFVKKYYLGG